jgi:glycosyltransferase involved in cell wall biosynthesis
MARANVLMLVENLSVPRDRRVWQEALALTKAGFAVDVICPTGEGRERERFEVREGVTIHRFTAAPPGPGPAGYAREYVVAFWRIARLALRLGRRRKFDIVHAANPPDILLLATLPLKLRGAGFVFDHHDLVPELYRAKFPAPSAFAYLALRAAEWMTFRLADVVVSTNDSYRAVAVTRGGKSRDSAFVVRNAPPESFLDPVPPRPALKRGRPHLLAYVGMMAPQDGVDHAVRALATLRARRDDWFAIFAGDGDALPSLRRLAAELDLEDRVQFPGFLPPEQIRELLETADVCLAPEPRTPFNDASTMIKIVEYMAAGRAIVSYDLVESRFSAAESAVYAHPNDEASFAACIDGLLANPERRRQLGTIGRERIRDELSWSASEQELLRAYERLLARRPPRERAKIRR